MKLYAILAVGECTCGWKSKIFCKKLFPTEEKAKAHIPEFKKKLHDPSHLEYFSEDEEIKFTFPQFEFDK